MLTLLFAPALTLHFLTLLVLFLASLGVVFWMAAQVPIPAPLNYVVYAILAIVALSLLFKFIGAL